MNRLLLLLIHQWKQTVNRTLFSAAFDVRKLSNLIHKMFQNQNLFCIPH